MSRYGSVDSRKSFWLDDVWPRDAPDGSYVFLGRAVLEVGKGLFPESWSDDDPKMAFTRRGTEYEQRERVKAVVERVGVAIARGDVGFALRPAKGGEFKPQKEALDGRDGALVPFGRANWNVDDFTDHFKFAQMNDGRFRPEQVPPLDWIYVERRTFERFITELSSAQEARSISLSFDDLPDFRDGRDELFAAVESGNMFLPNAEKIAAESGLVPLQANPDPNDYAVMDLTDWTMEMLLAWIIWRRPERVLQFYKPYHKAISYPSSPFESIPEPTLNGVKATLEVDAQLAAIGEISAMPSWEQVSRQVLEALRAGKITADATNLASTKSTDISSQEWKRLRLTSDDTGATVLVNNLNSAIYGDVMFEREQVLSVWRPPVEHNEVERIAATTAPTIRDQIRKLGFPKLSSGERQIWEAIEAIGGENALPPRRVDYKELIKKNVRGTRPSDSSIDRFFARFKPAD